MSGKHNPDSKTTEPPMTDAAIIDLIASAGAVDATRAAAILDALNDAGLFVVPGHELSFEQMMEPVDVKRT